jgi:hypothetical protein
MAGSAGFTGNAPAGAATLPVSGPLDQPPHGNGVLPIAQGRFSKSAHIVSFVMPGPVPGIPIDWRRASLIEIAGTSPAMTATENETFDHGIA